jgi:L-2-hydroxycarboxylate dehydrogenase (NAD+)
MLDTTVSPDELTSIVARIFEGFGTSESEADLVSKTLVEANLCGHPSHGVIRVLKWAEGLKTGAINPRPAPRIVKQSEGSALVDGDCGLGPVVADMAVNLVAGKARNCGIAMVSIFRASHIAMLQYYTRNLVRDRLVGIVMTNTESGMAPFGGIDKILGTNPVSIGVPGRAAPLILDMSSSQVARGKIVIAKSCGERIPDGWAIDSEGRPTNDPDAALEGALLPIGGAKGSGLAIMVDLLSSALAGGAVGKKVRGTFRMDQEGTKGDLFIAINPEAVAGLDYFLDRVEDLKADIQSSRVAPGFKRILFPGQFEAECRDRYLSKGIPIKADLLNQLKTWDVRC